MSKYWLGHPFSRVFPWILWTPALSYHIFIGPCCSAFWCPAFFLWCLQRHWIDINPHWPIQLSDLFKEPLFQFQNLELLSLLCVFRKHTSQPILEYSTHTKGEMRLEDPSSVKPRPWHMCIRLQPAPDFPPIKTGGQKHKDHGSGACRGKKKEKKILF